MPKSCFSIESFPEKQTLALSAGTEILSILRQASE
jgi:hypothetical protein